MIPDAHAFWAEAERLSRGIKQVQSVVAAEQALELVLVDVEQRLEPLGEWRAGLLERAGATEDVSLGIKDAPEVHVGQAIQD